MDLITARSLIKSTVQGVAPELGDKVYTSPKVSFQGLSPVVTIETQELGYVEDARQLYTLPYRLDVYVLALADAQAPGVPATIAELAEDQVCDLAQRIIPALRTMCDGMESTLVTIGNADFTPRNTPWRKVDKALIYRWVQIPVVIQESFGV